MTRIWMLPAFLAAFVAVGVAVIGMTLTELGPWYRALEQPAWAPPDPVYGVAWTLIFACAAVAGLLAWSRARDRREAELLIGLFALNGFLNLLWSLLFFQWQRPDWAMAELVLLWLSLAGLVLFCGRRSLAAGALLLPYLAWVTFAGRLNWEIVQLNAPFG
jgi:tryptophan-rich sensory protein